MAAPTPSGWADQRLSQAYELVYSVSLDWQKVAEPNRSLSALLDAIENADEDIVMATPTPRLLDGVQHDGSVG